MNIVAGTLLKSITDDEEDYFHETFVLIVENNEKGTIGFCLRKPFGRKLTDLQEFRHASPIVLFEGGPVQQDHLYCLYRANKAIFCGEKIAENMYYGGDFKALLLAISNDKFSPENVQVFIGYCGWDKGQLTEEIASGGWEILNIANENISQFCFDEK